MTPQERQMVDDLFDRLSKMESAQRDPDATAAITQGLRSAPNAIYPLVQTVLVQDEALRHADDRICAAERPGDPAAPPVAVVDVRVDKGLGPCEGREDHARNGVAWPVGGVQDLDPVAPNVRGEPQQAGCRRQGVGDAGELLKIGSSPQRWPKVRRTQRDAGNGAQLVERRCRRSRLSRRVQFKTVLRQVAQEQEMDPCVCASE